MKDGARCAAIGAGATAIAVALAGCTSSTGTSSGATNSAHPRAGAGEDHRPGPRDRPAGEGPRPARPGQHRRPRRHRRHPRAGPARLQLRAPAVPRRPGRHPVLRGLDLLEPVLDLRPRRRADHQPARPQRHRGGHQFRQAAVRPVIRENGVHGPTGQDNRRSRLWPRVFRPTRRLHLRSGRGDQRQLAVAGPPSSPANPRSRPTCRRRRWASRLPSPTNPKPSTPPPAATPTSPTSIAADRRCGRPRRFAADKVDPVPPGRARSASSPRSGVPGLG